MVEVSPGDWQPKRRVRLRTLAASVLVVVAMLAASFGLGLSVPLLLGYPL